jgi:hypothetical protein
MFIKSNGQVGVANGMLTEVGGGQATMGITKRNYSTSAIDKIGLLVADDGGVNPVGNTQVGIVNTRGNTDYAMYVVNGGTVSSYTNGLPNKAGVVVQGGNIGYFRHNVLSQWNATTMGYSCYSYVDEPGHTGGISTGFRSAIAIPRNDGRSITEIYDFKADEYETGAEGENGGVRYGLHLGFTKKTRTAAWGVYQTGSDVKNHFNGPSLFGTTTDNTIDKVQVVGGTLTDGFATANTTIVSTPTVLNTDHTLLADCTAGTFTITLPTSGVARGKTYAIKRVDATVNTVFVTPVNDGGGTTYTMAQRDDAIIVQYNGTSYDILGEVVR